jgi:hypothetical protein
MAVVARPSFPEPSFFLHLYRLRLLVLLFTLLHPLDAAALLHVTIVTHFILRLFKRRASPRAARRSEREQRRSK